jgi:multiple sugar transport system substrate-binding protein
MRQSVRAVATAAVAVLMFSACSSGATPSPTGGGASPSAAGSAPAFRARIGSGVVERVRPSERLRDRRPSGWQSSGAEGDALNATLDAFKAAYPNITLDYQPIATDYPTAMAAKFSSGEPPDLFYVDSSVAPDWIDQGVLQELDTMAQERGFDTSQFFPATSTPSRVRTARRTASRRTATRSAWPTTPDMLTAAGISRRRTGTS